MAKKRINEDLNFKDRKTGLVIFGIIHMIIGFFCALSMLFTIVGAIALRALEESTVPAMSTGQMMLAFLLYLLLAGWFVWMGVGSILARKWARALILITSWLWLLSGIGGFIFTLLFMPDLYGSTAMRGAMPQDMVIIVQSIVTAFMAFILIVIPSIFVLFYGSRHVKATCERRDPQVRWTDKAPLPVITLSSLWGATAISMPFSAFYRWTTPFFGFILSGIPGAVVVLIYALLFAYAAWGTYKLQIKAWWYGFLLTTASMVSIIMTFSRVSQLEFYEKMGISKEYLEILQEFDTLQNPTLLIFWGLLIIGFLGFVLYTKRYFKPSSP